MSKGNEMNVKMVYCKSCGNRIGAKLKKCPFCGTKNKKPIYARAWFIILVLIVVIGAIGSIGGKSKSKDPKSTSVNNPSSSSMSSALPTPSSAKKTPAPQTATSSSSPAATPTPAATTSQGGIRSEVKDAIDSYEAFVDEYCEFMKNYNSSDITMLTKYTELLSKEIDANEKFEKIEDMDLTDAEALYYSEVSLRCSQKMLAAASSMK